MQQKKIIIVEDEPDTAEMFSEMMRLGGYTVHKSYDGLAAIDLIVNEMPDAIVLDVMMPELSGLDVLKTIRKNPKLEKTPVIVVSAKSLPADIQAGLDAGATVYLSKPVAFQELRNAVSRVIQDAEQQQ